MNEIIALIITLVVVVSVLVYLFRAFTKLFVGIGIAYFIFHIGFIWDYDKFDEKVPIMDYFKSEYANGFKSWYTELSEQREEYAMLDIEKIEKDIDDGIKKSIEKAKDIYENVDKEELVDNVFSVIKDINYEVAKIEILENKDEFISQGITEKEFESLMIRLDEMALEMKELEEKINQ